MRNSYVSFRSASHSSARRANSEVAFWSVLSRCALQLCTAGDDANLDAEAAGVRLGAEVVPDGRGSVGPLS